MIEITFPGPKTVLNVLKHTELWPADGTSWSPFVVGASLISGTVVLLSKKLICHLAGAKI